MSEAEDIEKVVRALRKVPEKRLLLIELANRIPVKGGEPDYDELAKIQPEINLAIAEAKMYGAHTIMAVDSLKRLKPRKEDVGP
jgi:hypothetical protein